MRSENECVHLHPRKYLQLTRIPERNMRTSSLYAHRGKGFLRNRTREDSAMSLEQASVNGRSSVAVGQKLS